MGTEKYNQHDHPYPNVCTHWTYILLFENQRVPNALFSFISYNSNSKIQDYDATKQYFNSQCGICSSSAAMQNYTTPFWLAQVSAVKRVFGGASFN